MEKPYLSCGSIKRHASWLVLLSVIGIKGGKYTIFLFESLRVSWEDRCSTTFLFKIFAITIFLFKILRHKFIHNRCEFKSIILESNNPTLKYEYYTSLNLIQTPRSCSRFSAKLNHNSNTNCLGVKISVKRKNEQILLDYSREKQHIFSIKS